MFALQHMPNILCMEFDISGLGTYVMCLFAFLLCIGYYQRNSDVGALEATDKLSCLFVQFLSFH